MRITVINRLDRTDRLVQIIEELRSQKLNAVRFTAFVDKIGWRGCRDSHLSILQENLSVNSHMVLEDDAVFIEDIDPYLYDAIEQLPDNWDMLYLGCSPQCPQEKYSENLYKIVNAKTTHAILWHNRIGGAVEYILNDISCIKKIDDYLCTIIHTNFNCFAVYPMLATQRKSKSNISIRTDENTILRNFNKYCP